LEADAVLEKEPPSEPRLYQPTIICPETRKRVIAMEGAFTPSAWTRLTLTGRRASCPYCRRDHAWEKEDAVLVPLPDVW
jgi:hypothetical protein